MSGTAQIFPQVGSNIPVPLPTKDAADGTPGSAASTTAIQVAGVDQNGDLQAVATDPNGYTKVIGPVQNGLVIATNPMYPVLFGGYDGTYVHNILTDFYGRVNVDLFGHAGTVMDGAPGAASPPNAVQIGGTDGTDLRAILTDTTGRIVESSAGLTLNGTGQVSVGSSATLISAASATQAGVLITNPSSTITVYLGGSGVTTSTGAILAPGTSVTIPTVSAVYGIVATGTQTVSFLSLTE